MEELELKLVSGLDWITVTDLIDEDHPSGDMEVINTAEVLVGEEKGLYIMAIYPDDADILDEEEEETEDEDEEIETYLFKVCDEKDAEYVITDEADTRIYVTATFTDEEFDTVSNLFIETTEEYEISIDED